jgi:hypothetical protein
VIGLLGGGAPESFAPGIAALRQGLQEAGFVEGRNAAVQDFTETARRLVMMACRSIWRLLRRRSIP